MVDNAMKVPSPRSTAGLWWTAFWILAVGGTAGYLLSRHTDPASRTLFNVILAITLLGSGLFIICATADW
jgi:CHASE2 domain-containing sensor protein